VKKRLSRTMFWKKLKGTNKKPINKNDVERLIAGLQQEIILDDRDHATYEAIENGKIDWTGEKQ